MGHKLHARLHADDAFIPEVRMHMAHELVSSKHHAAYACMWSMSKRLMSTPNAYQPTVTQAWSSVHAGLKCSPGAA